MIWKWGSSEMFMSCTAWPVSANDSAERSHRAHVTTRVLSCDWWAGTVRNGRQLTKPLTKFIIVNSRIWPLGQIRRVHCVYSFLVVQSDPDIPAPDIPEPRYTGSISFPRYRKLSLFYPYIPAPRYTGQNGFPRGSRYIGVRLYINNSKNVLVKHKDCFYPVW